MVDVTEIPSVKVYDKVILIGKSVEEMLAADDMAQMLGTIGYKEVCDVGKRVQRVYLQESRFYKLQISRGGWSDEKTCNSWIRWLW